MSVKISKVYPDLQDQIPVFTFKSIMKFIVKLQFNESQVLEAKRAETCWTNYPRSEATRDYPMCEFKWYYSLLRNVFKACFGVHTRD